VFEEARASAFIIPSSISTCQHIPFLTMTLCSVNAAKLASDVTKSNGPYRLLMKYIECDFGVKGMFKRT